MWAWPCHDKLMGVRGQLTGVGLLLSQCGFWRNVHHRLVVAHLVFGWWHCWCGGGEAVVEPWGDRGLLEEVGTEDGLWCALSASWLPLCCCSTTDSPWELFLHKSLLQRQQKGNQYTDWSMSPRFIKQSESPVWPMLLIVCMILALLHGINLRLSMELWIGLELMSQ